MNISDRLRALVAIDSVSARSNRPIIEQVVQQLAPLGGEVFYRTWTDAAGIEKINLVMRWGPPGPPALALVAHSDTVPFDTGWTEALSLTERDGRLYGRGSADTKGGLAAMIEALLASDPGRCSAPLLLIATADEEIGCLGAKRLQADGDLHPRHAIVAEPTRLIPIRGHKGYCADRVEVRGREAHSAYPHLGRSAIIDAGHVLVAIEQVADALQDDIDSSFDPPFTTLNVGTIEGGKARNVIAGSCRFPLEWRPIPSQPLNLVHEQIEQALTSLQLDLELVEVRRDPGGLTPVNAELIRFLEKETGHASETVAFSTEMPYLNALGAQTCVVGPGDIREAHRTGEFIPVAELEAAVQIYRNAIERFCPRE